MRNVFTFNQIRCFRENGASEKIKAHFSQHPAALQQLFSLHLFKLIQKKLALPPFKIVGAETIHST